MRRWRIVYILFFHLLFLQLIQAQPDFTGSETFGCTPFRVSFILDPATVDIDTIATLEWVSGDGQTLTTGPTDTAEFIYNNAGEYSVAMVVDGDRPGIVKTDYISVHRTLSSSFTYEEYATNHNFRFIPLDKITDNAATYFFNWSYTELANNQQRTNDYVVTIGNQEIAVDSVTLDTGAYRVRLWIDDTYGCVSRSEDTIYVYDAIVLPNYFVAGHPSPNEFYTIDPLNGSIVLRFQVFNRNGLLVFEQEAPVIRWDGKTNSGRDLSVGVYYYLLKAIEGINAERFDQKGFIHLYRVN